jgi:hypothetical protein
LSACGIGSSTTQRPALLEPAVAPDGTFWDAVEVSRRDNARGFLHIVSPRFLQAAFLPNARIAEPTSQRAFDEMRVAINRELERAAVRNEVDLEQELNRLAAGYMRQLRDFADSNYVEVSKPEYDIRYTDQFGRANGPNRAWVYVTLHPKEPGQEATGPARRRVVFVQDGLRWLIERFEPDPNFGAFTWTQ